MKNIVSWSGGKDSTATIIIAHQLKIPIEVCTCIVWFDKKRKIYGNNPAQIHWMLNRAVPMINGWGYKVNIVETKHDYTYWFHRILDEKARSDRIGKKHGFLIPGKCALTREKCNAIKSYEKKQGNHVSLIGIAADEPVRLARLKDNQRSLLAEQGYTGAMAFDLCEKYGLLSPSYKTSMRDGCWFCPNGKIKEFALLKKIIQNYGMSCVYCQKAQTWHLRFFLGIKRFPTFKTQ